MSRVPHSVIRGAVGRSSGDRSCGVADVLGAGAWPLPPAWYGVLARDERARGCSSMAEHQLPKLTVRVRFPSPAPPQRPSSQAVPAPSWPLRFRRRTPACPLRARCPGRQWAIQSRRDGSVPVGCGVQVDARGAGARMSHAGHEIRQRRSGLRSQRVSRVAEIVKVNAAIVEAGSRDGPSVGRASARTDQAAVERAADPSERPPELATCRVVPPLSTGAGDQAASLVMPRLAGRASSLNRGCVPLRARWRGNSRSARGSRGDPGATALSTTKDRSALCKLVPS
jgi:hypothetical protein